MRIMVSGGGTGGHIYPAVTVIRTIQRLAGKSEILYVGTKAGLEADLIPKEGLPLATIDVQGFARSLSPANAAAAIKTVGAVWQSRRLIREFRPDVVVGTGGYVCGPVLLAAVLLGVPSMIQEQNVIPGVTNRILARFVDRVAVGYAEAAPRFARPDKVVHTGNPIRTEVMTADRAAARAGLGLAADALTVLISGGSRGARSVNRAMTGVYRTFAGHRAVQFLHATGTKEFPLVVDDLRRQGINWETAGNIMIKPYLYDMPQALAAADAAIFRAGALGLAELTARGVPAILIPYPYAAANHQEFNARQMADRGAAVMVKDDALQSGVLNAVLQEWLADRPKLERMAAASRSLGRPEAAETIARLAIELGRGR